MLWYSLEAPRQGASNEYHNICFCGEIRKISYFWPEKSALTSAVDHNQGAKVSSGRQFRHADQTVQVHRLT